MEQSIVFWTIVGAVSTGAATLIAILGYASGRRREEVQRHREAIEAARTRTVAAVLLAISRYYDKYVKLAAGSRWTGIAKTYRSGLIDTCVSAACAIPENANLAAGAPNRNFPAHLRARLESLLPDFTLHRPYPENEMHAQAGATTLAGVGMGTILPGIGHIAGALVGSVVGYFAIQSTHKEWERGHKHNLDTHCTRCKEVVEKSLARLL